MLFHVFLIFIDAVVEVIDAVVEGLVVDSVVGRGMVVDALLFFGFI